MDLQAWGEQRARYSRARHGRTERGAAVGECALIQAVTEAMGLRLGVPIGRGVPAFAGKSRATHQPVAA